MKANELMIGDWVRVTEKADKEYFYGEYKPGDIVQVNEILDYGVNPDWCGAEVNDVLHLEAIEPIPLSPEIMRANGFEIIDIGDNGHATPKKYFNRYEKWECKTTWRNIDMWFDRTTKKWSIHGLNQVSFSHVHIMQHGFHYLGIDKEIIIK